MTAPAVAWFGVGSNVGKVVAADADNGWDGSLNVDTINKVEGSASLGEKVSNTTIELYTVNTTDVVGEPFDFSASGGNDGDHIFGWLNIFAAWDTLTNGGFGLRVADDLATDSLGTWYVGPQPGYLGGWANYVINPAADFDGVVAGTATWTTTGNPAQLSGVDGFGCRWKVTVSITGNTDNAFVDCISVGQGYRLTLGDGVSTEGTFQDLIDFEEGASGRFGGLTARGGILFAKCKIAIGAASGATDTEMIDSGFTVVWEPQVLSDGTSSAVAVGFYELRGDQDTGTTDITLSDGSLAAKSPHDVVVDLSGLNSATLTAVALDRGRSVLLDDAVSWTDSSITNTGLVTLGGATFSGCTLSGGTMADAVDESQMLWNFNADPNGELDGITVTKGANAHHALEFGASAPLTMTLTNWTTVSFNAVDGNNDSTFYFADRGSDVTWTLNIVGGSGSFSFKKARAGDTVNIVEDPVTLTVTATGAADGLAVEGARVLVLAGTDFESGASVGITRSGSTATVSHTGHGFETGNDVRIRDATQNEYNGIHSITVTGANAYTYTVSGTPATPATGSPVSSLVIINALTNASGVVSDTRAWAADQAFRGIARRGGANPRVSQPLSGTIDSAAGASIPAPMSED